GPVGGSDTVRASGFAGCEAAFENIGFESAFAQDVCRRGTAPAGVATHDILRVLVERVDFQSNEVQRDIHGIVDAKILKLARQPDIEPLAAAGDDFARLLL